MNNEGQDYHGTIIEESLFAKSVLQDVEIVSTKVEPATERHQTPWLTQWALHTMSVPEQRADVVAQELSNALDGEHHWYADFRNDSTHYIIFKHKVFKIDRTKPEQYQAATDYGLAHGIPEHQLDFSGIFLQPEKEGQ